MAEDKINGAEAAPAEPFVNYELVSHLTRLLEETKAGKVVNAAIAITSGPGNSAFLIPNGPGASDLYLALGAIRLRIEQASFPFLVDQSLAEYQMRAQQAVARGPKLIVPNGPLPDFSRLKN